MKLASQLEACKVANHVFEILINILNEAFPQVVNHGALIDPTV